MSCAGRPDVIRPRRPSQSGMGAAQGSEEIVHSAWLGAPDRRTITVVMNELYPLLTEHRLVQPIWGGPGWAAWLTLPEPRPERLGETWEVYDQNRISNGPLAGRTLAEASQQLGAALVGTRTLARYGPDFPLLAKFID